MARTFSIKHAARIHRDRRDLLLSCSICRSSTLVALCVQLWGDIDVAVWGGFSLKWFQSAWQNDAGASMRRCGPFSDRRHCGDVFATVALLTAWRRWPQPVRPPYPGLTFKYAFDQPAADGARDRHWQWRF